MGSNPAGRTRSENPPYPRIGETLSIMNALIPRALPGAKRGWLKASIAVFVFSTDPLLPYLTISFIPSILYLRIKSCSAKELIKIKSHSPKR